MVVSGLLLARAAPWWWLVCGVAAISSQAVIATSWTDAGVGTVVNVLLIGAAVYGWASQGLRSLGREYQRRVLDCPLRIARPASYLGIVVTEQDLAPLPTSVAAFVRGTGAVGRPRVTSLRAHLHGRIRASASST